ncbi:FecR family protein [Turneriella parva DSM 21527]|uniref:FecR family protein n=2 Tax=Turneriella TaxID=338321 RepID=I4B939_TURPD|nr:FecR family protein [Turneriella parva DSM 21527]
MKKGFLPPRGMIFTLLLFFTWVFSLQAEARFASLKGTVQIYEKQKWVNATAQTKLPSGAMIQTAYRSQAVVIYPQGGQLAIGPNTRVTIFDNPGGAGTDREMMIDHGQLSAFVKKGPEGARNAFRIRSPTTVAGVRGSLIAGRLVGQTLTVSAIQSAAQIEMSRQQSRIRSAELQLANARKNLADQQARVKATEEYVKQLKDEIKTLEADNSPRNAARLNQAIRMLNLYSNNVAIYSADLKKMEQFEATAVTKLAAAKADLAAIAAEEKALIESLEKSQPTKIAEGDSAAAEGEIIPPLESEKKKVRPANLTTVGQTGSEEKFTQQSDVKVGVGSDFQQIYNNVNSVTQPTSTGLPTLKKL